jgi:hypothetical protein
MRHLARVASPNVRSDPAPAGRLKSKVCLTSGGPVPVRSSLLRIGFPFRVQFMRVNHFYGDLKYRSYRSMVKPSSDVALVTAFVHRLAEFKLVRKSLNIRQHCARTGPDIWRVVDAQGARFKGTPNFSTNRPIRRFTRSLRTKGSNHHWRLDSSMHNHPFSPKPQWLGERRAELLLEHRVAEEPI